MSSRFDEEDLPALFASADALANRGQRTAKRYIGTELFLLIAAGATGVTSVRVGPAGIDVLAVVGAIAFVGALVTTGARALRRPENDWYTGRAAAESVKTLAWRYAVGGDPLPIGAPGVAAADAEERFLSRLRDILAELDDVTLEATAVHATEITRRMREHRAAPFTQRRDLYLGARITDQLSWYRERAGDHRRSARRWVAIALTAAGLGLVAACLKAIGLIDVDVLGVAASCATSAIGWTQTNQHRNLASAYRLTARELSIVRDRLADVPEPDWALTVSDAEDAMSREHTMWSARHGHPGIGRS